MLKESFEANKSEILKNLPEEFHADFEKELAALPNDEPAPKNEDELTGDALAAAIKAELKANPTIDENAIEL